MDRWYELWDSVASSLVGQYETQERALRVVRQSLVDLGPESLKSLVLLMDSAEENVDGPEVLAAGLDLIQLAEASYVPAFAGTGKVVSISGQAVRGVARHPVVTGNWFHATHAVHESLNTPVTFENAV